MNVHSAGGVYTGQGGSEWEGHLSFVLFSVYERLFATYNGMKCDMKSQSDENPANLAPGLFCSHSGQFL